ncbi:MAG: hypothetical protein AUJ07_02160 [Crenarchaeota archaeon 13_1_40CM_3_53_5]|nr:MAG: hypothetical protein AUJ07_02160 [Crenarchaeota archaeon 13_1_40CM_3_53_5]
MSLLDNPAWNAPSTSHASFAERNQLAKRYPVDVSPLAATRDQSAESYHSLAQLLGPAGTTELALVAVPDLPAGWTVARVVPCFQMVWNGPVPPPVEHSVEDLNTSHVDEMLALAELTKLDAFRRRSPELGAYLGIREAGQLVAMAGEELRLLGYSEIGSVCTRPDRRGRGYAGSLISTLIQRITKRDEIPFLHVRTENVGAIRVYEKLGFQTRCIINFVLVKRE